MSIKSPPISLAARSRPPTFLLFHMVLSSGSANGTSVISSRLNFGCFLD